jgi:hypothetical protein
MLNEMLKKKRKKELALEEGTGRGMGWRRRTVRHGGF